MKINAIIRIVIWSFVILLLAGILTAGLGLGKLWDVVIAESPMETAVPQRIDSSSAAPLPANEPIILTREIKEVSIQWVSGTVEIRAADISHIRLSESNVDSRYALSYRLKEDELDIFFCEDTVSGKLGRDLDFSKDLLLEVPHDWFCQELEIDTAAMTLEAQGVRIQDVEIDGASVSCDFENCTVDTLDVDTATCDVEFTGHLNALDSDAATSSFTGVLTNVPHRIDFDGMTNDLDLTLPEDAGFTVTMDALNSDFSSDFETTIRNGNYIHGSGDCRISVDGVTGDVILRKAPATAP